MPKMIAWWVLNLSMWLGSYDYNQKRIKVSKWNGTWISAAIQEFPYKLYSYDFLGIESWDFPRIILGIPWCSQVPSVRVIPYIINVIWWQKTNCEVKATMQFPYLIVLRALHNSRARESVVTKCCKIGEWERSLLSQTDSNQTLHLHWGHDDYLFQVLAL